MTTINTIIEEEKEKARKQFDDSPVSLRIDALESYAHVHGWSQFEGRTIQDEIDTIVTTAMQRAYEAGRDEDTLKGERRRVVEMINNIGHEGCACGEYKSENLIAHATCRKSSSSPDCSIGIAHLLKFNPLNEEGLKELGDIVDTMLCYGADCVVLVKDNKLK